MSDIGRSERRLRDQRRAEARWDQIEIHGLEVFAHHGVYEHERTEGQRFLLDITLDADAHIAARTDDLDDAVDYGKVAREIAAFVRETRFNLLETLATRIADRLLESSRIAAVSVHVTKPDVDLGETVDHVAVTVRRSRPMHL